MRNSSVGTGQSKIPRSQDKKDRNPAHKSGCPWILAHKVQKNSNYEPRLDKKLK
jgi:hypothetical protein